MTHRAASRAPACADAWRRGTALQARARHDDGQFVELSQMIVNEGIKPLNDLLDALAQPKRGFALSK